MEKILFILLAATLVVSLPWPCDRDEAIAAFKTKTLVNHFPFLSNDPYGNQTDASLQDIRNYMANKSVVCGLMYTDASKQSYQLRTFVSADEATTAGYIVTHQGRCELCSTTVDLAVYLGQNLTTPVRKCALKAIVSHKWAVNCLKVIGFSDNCAEVWFYNTLNTRKECFGVCMKSYIMNEPFNKPDGTLNDCLQCDEDKSGPVFKYFSGRTRRNSGVESAIHRPASTVYNMTHCYF